MKPKIKKYNNNRKNISTIYIENIFIEKEHIYDILQLFNYEELIIESSINNNCKWINEIHQNKAEIFTPIVLNPKTEYTEMICLTKSKQTINYVIDNVIEYERNDNYLFVVDKNDKLSFNQYLYGYHTFHFINKLIINEIVSFSINFDFKESAIYITLNSKKYDIDLMIDKIKQVFC